MSVNFRNTKFIKSAPTLGDRPDEFADEYLFVGKSNVGKSSLLNALCDHKNLAKTSSKPGHTTFLNYFNVDDEFYIVDAPGYGYSARGQEATIKFGQMMEDYFRGNPYLKGVLFLIDSRHAPSADDEDFYTFLKASGVPFTLILTKCDKLNQKGKAAIKLNLLASFPDLDVNVIYTSSLNKASLEGVKKQLAEWRRPDEN